VGFIVLISIRLVKALILVISVKGLGFLLVK